MRHLQVNEFEPVTSWHANAAKDAVRFTSDDGFVPAKFRVAPRRALNRDQNAAHKKRRNRLYGLDD